MVWTGFIKAPVSDIYTFEFITDDGGIVKINNDAVVVDRMSEEEPLKD